MSKNLFLYTFVFSLIATAISLYITLPAYAEDLEIQLRIEKIECNFEEIYDGQDPQTVAIPDFCNNTPEPEDFNPKPITPPKDSSVLIPSAYPLFERPLLPSKLNTPQLNTSPQKNTDIYAGATSTKDFENILFLLLIIIFIALVVDRIYFKGKRLRRLILLFFHAHKSSRNHED